MDYTESLLSQYAQKEQAKFAKPVKCSKRLTVLGRERQFIA
jgi:hypothetical protein